jgi:hypothetical protein
VGDEQRGSTGVEPDALQLDIHLPAEDLVEGAERLIQEKEPGLGDEGAGDGHPLPHAARKLGRHRLLEALEAHELDQAADALPWQRPAQHIERQGDVALDRAPGQQSRVLEGDPELAAAGDGNGALAADRHLPGICDVQPGRQAQDGGLAAAGRADQGREGAGRAVEVDAVDDRERLTPAAGESLHHAA